MGQAIQDGVSDQRIFKEVHPFLDMTTAGHDDGRDPVAFDNNFVKVVSLFRGEFLEAEVVHNEKGGTEQSEQFFVEGVIGSTLEQSFEEEIGSDQIIKTSMPLRQALWPRELARWVLPTPTGPQRRTFSCRSMKPRLKRSLTFS